jgi:hypothetical protein
MEELGKKREFIARVREHKAGNIICGRIISTKLKDFINKKVKVIVEEV